MEEVAPVITGIILGFAVWRGAKGGVRFVLLALSIFAAGLIATVVTGEYHTHWYYLLLDMALASGGVLGGILLARRARHRSELPILLSDRN
jgi:hypothetical protein